MVFKTRMIPVILALLASWTSHATAETPGPEMTLEVQWDCARPTMLTMTLQSSKTREVEAFESELPWGNHYSVILEAVLTRNGVALEKYFPIDDPGDSVLRIAPGSTVNGEINLKHRFVNAEDVLGRQEVVLFWSYQFREKEGDALQRTGGWVLASPDQRSTADNEGLK